MAEAVQNWDEIAAWWREEAASDPSYRQDVWPIIEGLLPAETGRLVELGCGEGQWLRRLSGSRIGSDRSLTLLSDALPAAPVVCAQLPDLAWLRDDSIDTALSVFVLDLIDDEARFFAETARTSRDNGVLVVVINHPAFTAPASGPIADIDGEVLWRWGSYLEDGSSLQPAGEGVVRFYHRPVSHLLSAAADAGWALEAMVEAPLGPATLAGHPGYGGQEGMPRYLGGRWRLTDP